MCVYVFVGLFCETEKKILLLGHTKDMNKPLDGTCILRFGQSVLRKSVIITYYECVPLKFRHSGNFSCTSSESRTIW